MHLDVYLLLFWDRVVALRIVMRGNVMRGLTVFCHQSLMNMSLTLLFIMLLNLTILLIHLIPINLLHQPLHNHLILSTLLLPHHLLSVLHHPIILIYRRHRLIYHQFQQRMLQRSVHKHIVPLYSYLQQWPQKHVQTSRLKFLQYHTACSLYHFQQVYQLWIASQHLYNLLSRNTDSLLCVIFTLQIQFTCNIQQTALFVVLVQDQGCADKPIENILSNHLDICQESTQTPYNVPSNSLHIPGQSLWKLVHHQHLCDEWHHRSFQHRISHRAINQRHMMHEIYDISERLYIDRNVLGRKNYLKQERQNCWRCFLHCF